MVRLAWTSREKKVLALGLLSALLAVALNLISLYVTPMLLSAVEAHVPVGELLLTIAAFTGGLMLVSAASAYVNANTMFGRFSVRCEIINLLNRKSATTSYPNVDDDGFRKLLSKSNECVNSNEAATEAVWTTLTALTANALGLAVYAGLLTSLQPLLLLFIVANAAVGYLISAYANGYGYRHRDQEAEAERRMEYLSRCAGDMGAAKDIRIFGLRPWLEELYGKAMDACTAYHRRAQGVYVWARIADLALAFLRNAVAYAYLIGLTVENGLDAAEFLLYFTAIGGFSEWAAGILNGFSLLHRQSLDISTVRECLEFDEPFKFDCGERLVCEPGKRYEIKLENVTYRYPGADKDVLTDIGLTLRPGEKLAVVGLNGAGKTTLVKLICGLLDPVKGRVLLDGVDIRRYNRADYYAFFSAVFQNFSLLAGTVRANIAQRDDCIDMERVRECAEKAGLRAKLESLPDGYGTYLNREVYEGAVQLSGGETQRLMLARALYKDAPFVVLDEPTAALDPVAEADMYHKYDDMTGGRTSVYISHRLASTRFCDRIILLDGAGICEEGSHAELLRRGGKYAALFETQSRYYREGAGNAEEIQT